MTSRRLELVGLGLLLVSLAACGAGDGPPAGAAYYAYIADPLVDCVYTFSIDPETGVLAQEHGEPRFSVHTLQKTVLDLYVIVQRRN